MSIEEEVTELMRRSTQGLPGAVFYAAGDTAQWFAALTRDERDELFLRSLSGMFDAVQHLARAVDALS